MRLGGISEVAAELGISRQRVAQLRATTGFPPPAGEIAAGAIWDLDEVLRWNGSGIRRPPGRPKQSKTVLGDRYVLDAPAIGSGGFADVFRATDLRQSESQAHAVVAVKVLRDIGDVEVRKRFKRELRLLAELSHPNIVPILDDGETPDGVLWYAMPLAKGNLAEEVETFAGNEDRILRVMRQICSGLAYVHAQGIFHRDLKPANVLRIGSDTWAISDFGLAREAERTSTALTSTLQGVGTYFYAAPEAWSNAKYAEQQADIYSVGKLLQHLLTGDLPVSPDPPQGRFSLVVQKATRQRADQRYAAVDDLVTALEGAAAAPDKWSSLDEDANQLAGRLRAEVPDDLAIAELTEFVLAGPADQDAAVRALRQIIPVMSRGALTRLWTVDEDNYRRILAAYGEHVTDSNWEFGFCDTIADFFERSVLVSNDARVTGIALGALFQLGTSHNRWHVRDVVISILQRIRDGSTAIAAAEAIEEADASDVAWTLSGFVVRSLHPTVRDAAQHVITAVAAE